MQEDTSFKIKSLHIWRFNCVGVSCSRMGSAACPERWSFSAQIIRLPAKISQQKLQLFCRINFKTDNWRMWSDFFVLKASLWVGGKRRDLCGGRFGLPTSWNESSVLRTLLHKYYTLWIHAFDEVWHCFPCQVQVVVDLRCPREYYSITFGWNAANCRSDNETSTSFDLALSRSAALCQKNHCAGRHFTARRWLLAKAWSRFCMSKD